MHFTRSKQIFLLSFILTAFTTYCMGQRLGETALSVKIGTLGLGGDVTIGLCDYVNVRVAAHVLHFDYEGEISDIDWDFEMDFKSIGVAWVFCAGVSVCFVGVCVCFMCVLCVCFPFAFCVCVFLYVCMCFCVCDFVYVFLCVCIFCGCFSMLCVFVCVGFCVCFLCVCFCVCAFCMCVFLCPFCVCVFGCGFWCKCFAWVFCAGVSVCFVTA